MVPCRPRVGRPPQRLPLDPRLPGDPLRVIGAVSAPARLKSAVHWRSLGAAADATDVRVECRTGRRRRGSHGTNNQLHVLAGRSEGVGGRAAAQTSSPGADIWRTLHPPSGRGSSIRLQWAPAHCGLPGKRAGGHAGE